MQNKKTIILSSLDNREQKAVVSLEKAKEGYVGYVKLYNVADIKGILSLGVLANGNVFKAGLNLKEKNHYTFYLQNNKLPDNFSCALVQILNGEVKPIMMGATDKLKATSNEIRLASCVELLDDKNLTFEKTKQVLDQNGIDFEDDCEDIVGQSFSDNAKFNFTANDCATCKYREAFYSVDAKNNLEKNNDNSQNNEEIMQKNNFYAEILPQINEIFEIGEEEKTLQNIIPNSKWVRVDYNKDGHYYVIGLIEGDEKVKYVCYGIPGVYAEIPPSEIGLGAKWLPSDSSKPFETGYWLLYQDSDTGERLEVDIV